MNYPPAVIQDIEKNVDMEIGGAAMSFGTNAVIGILDAVRTRVLDWVLELVKAGVRGDGELSFSTLDREAATHVTYNITVGGSVTGNVGSVAGHATVTAMHIGSKTIQTLTSFAEQLGQVAGQMGLSAADQAALERHAAELRQEVGRPVPDISRLGKVLASIRSIAENAGGSLLASGVLHILGTPDVAAIIARVLQ